MADVCADCKKPLGTSSQGVLFGTQRCIRCETNHQGDRILRAADGADSLTDWEEEFVASVKGQRLGGRDISEKQYQVLERIERKL